MFTPGIAELMDNHEFLRDSLEQSISSLGITMETRTFKRLRKPIRLQSRQIHAVNCMTQKEQCLVKGGSLADDYNTAKVKPCCALQIYCSLH